jgi:hypothetical protein
MSNRFCRPVAHHDTLKRQPGIINAWRFNALGSTAATTESYRVAEECRSNAAVDLFFTELGEEVIDFC